MQDVTAILFTAMTLSAPGAVSAAPQGEIQPFLDRYFSALSTGNAATIEASFVQGATITGLYNDDKNVQQLTVSTVPEFIAWLDGTRRRFERLEMRILTLSINRRHNLAEATAKVAIREKETGKEERTLRSTDLFHLVYHDGRWQIAGHAWTME